MKRRAIKPILRVAKDEDLVPYLFRLFESCCDYNGHSRYLQFSRDPQWNVWADGKPDAAACLLHLGRAVIETCRRHPGAAIEIRPWEHHQAISLGRNRAPAIVPATAMRSTVPSAPHAHANML